MANSKTLFIVIGSKIPTGVRIKVGPYLSLLRLDRKLIIDWRYEHPFSVPHPMVMLGRKSITGSFTGSMEEIEERLRKSSVSSLIIFAASEPLFAGKREAMYRLEKTVNRRERDNPSFSSTLLDKIYRSIDGGDTSLEGKNLNIDTKDQYGRDGSGVKSIHLCRVESGAGRLAPYCPTRSHLMQQSLAMASNE
ncbi:hypothetical protein GOBAR_DD04710 [Gossypium barbadense]|nr:hypothetical protein GOBAR_DD04710 [Gossypium barbadense]